MPEVRMDVGSALEWRRATESRSGSGEPLSAQYKSAKAVAGHPRFACSNAARVVKAAEVDHGTGERTPRDSCMAASRRGVTARDLPRRSTQGTTALRGERVLSADRLLAGGVFATGVRRGTPISRQSSGSERNN